MKTKIFTLIASLYVLTSCSYSTYPMYTTASYPNTNPDEILICMKDIDEEYEIISLVGADVKVDSAAVVKQIKKKASRQGADAIIHFKLNRGYSSSGFTGASGVAVKLVRTADVRYSLR